MIKLLIYLTFLFLFPAYSWADKNIQVSKLNEIQIDDVELDYSLEKNLERIQSEERFNLNRDLDLILKAKFKLVNGDIKMSEFYLNQIDNRSTKLLSVKMRYMALIEFIQGNFKKSLNYINDAKLRSIGIYSNICLLKLIDLMALNNLIAVADEGSGCAEETRKFSKNDQLWLDVMIKLKLRNIAGVKKSLLTDVEGTLSDEETARVWLKTGLYLNKEKDLMNLLSLIPETSYQSNKIREILALMHLRQGEKEQALSFVDDIDSANAENIKGNINLQNKQYELAFGHFKLALAKKADSENALERAIPLSWILNQFEDGLSMLNKVTNKKLDIRKKRAIKIAYLIRLKKYDLAREEMIYLKNEFQNVAPFEVNVMESYLNMITIEKNKKFDKRKVEESSELACKAFDGFSCWMSMSHIHWENLGKTIKRDEELFVNKEFNIDSLKNKKAYSPLKELPTIDQRDIEELDSETIQLN